MHGFNTQAQLSNQQAATNLVTTQDYVDFNSYNIWIPCTDLVDATGVATISYNSDTPIKIYPDAVLTRSVFSFRKPKHWVDGVVGARVHYTGLYVAGTNTIVGLRFNSFKNGDTLGINTYGEASAPTPSADNVYMICSLFEELNTSTLNANLQISEGDRLVTGSIRRRGAAIADTYTSDFELIGIEVFYKEYKHSSYLKSENRKWAY